METFRKLWIGIGILLGKWISWRKKKLDGFNLYENITINVAKTGNDALADGTESKPFLTVAAAINYASKLYGCYFITISIGDGTYNEQKLLITNARNIELKSKSASAAKVTLSFNDLNTAIYMGGCIRIYLTNLTITMSGATYGRIIDINSSIIHIKGCILNAAASYIGSGSGVHVTVGSNAVVETIAINKANLALVAAYGSIVFAANLSGSNNQIGYDANSGIIMRTGTTLSAVTLERKYAPSQIFS